MKGSIIIAQISFKAGSYAQYTALGTYDPSTLYFISEGAIYKGNVNCTDQVVIVETLPQTLVGGKIYIEKDSGKVTYYDGTTSTVVIPATVGSIGDSTPDTDLANVKAIKDFVAAEIAKIPAQVDYTVTITDETAGTGEKTKQTIKQGKAGSEKEVGTIVVPDLKMGVKATPNDGYLKTYQFTYGTGATFEVDIPRDLVVTAGEVIVVSDDAPVTGLTNGTYLKLTIANQSTPVYINTNSLVDVYTGKTVTDGVSIAVSSTNEISATLVGKAVSEANLEETLAKKITDAEESFTWGSIA